MKKRLLILSTYLLCSFSLSAQTAQNISFTDLDGTTHDLYSYLDSGYTVILDFSYEYCNPCYDWSVNVGHDLWENYGPSGNNTLRMFFFDVETDFLATDEDVANYTQEWGIEYPVINRNGPNTFPEYYEEGYPTIYVICPDTTYSETIGYGYPVSEGEGYLYIEHCLGNDINSNSAMFSANKPTPQTLCDAEPIQYVPTLTILQNDAFTGAPLNTNPFEVQVFVNGQYLETQNVNPNNQNATQYVFYLTPTLDPITVDFNDTLTFVGVFVDDNLAIDDSLTVIIPSEINTPTSTDSSLTLTANNSSLYHDLYNSEGELILSQGSGTANFNLEVDSCYSISFANSHISGATLEDANGQEVFSFEAGEFEGNSTPKIYFHVSNSTVGIENQYPSKKTISEYYFIDMLGKRYEASKIDRLPKGMYIEVKHFDNGYAEQRTVLKSE